MFFFLRNVHNSSEVMMRYDELMMIAVMMNTMIMPKRPPGQRGGFWGGSNITRVKNARESHELECSKS